MFRRAGEPDPVYSEVIELDLGTVEPSLAGPKRPQDRVPLNKAKAGFQTALTSMMASSPQASKTSAEAGGSAHVSPTRGDAAAAVLDATPLTTALEHASAVIAPIPTSPT